MLEIFVILTFILSVILVIAFGRVMKLIEKKKGRKWWYRNIYLKMPTWKLSRKVAFLVYGHKCKTCGTPLRLDVDHKSYKHMWWEWLFFWDLQILCRYHHIMKHEN